MRWLYRLQTQMGLTGPEGTAALVLLLALTGGVTARHFQATSEPVPADFYAAADAAFAAPAALSAGTDGGANGPPRLMGPATAGAPDDSTAAQIADAEVEAAAAPRRTGKLPPVRTNINTASEADLQRLPRVGPALAARIVAYRRENGPFRSPEQITEVRGIGEKTLEKLAPWIHI